MKLDKKSENNFSQQPKWCPCQGDCVGPCQGACWSTGCSGACLGICTGCMVTQRATL